MRIDAHHHFWNYTTAEYGWIDGDMAALQRDFLPTDLEREIARAGVDGVVSVQARQTLEETAWLLGLAAKHNFIKGVVGWVELANPGVGAALAQFASNPKLRGIRHVVQGEPDDNFILGPDTRENAVDHSYSGGSSRDKTPQLCEQGDQGDLS